MSTPMNDQKLSFLKTVNEIMQRNAGVKFTDILSEMPTYFKEKANQEAMANPERFATNAMNDFNLAPREKFNSPEDAKHNNLRRAALVAFCKGNAEWSPGADRHAGAVFRELDDGRVARISISPSDDGGQLGFAIAISDDAMITPSDRPGRIDVKPEIPEFMHVASGFDIKDAIQGYNRHLDMASAPAPRV